MRCDIRLDVVEIYLKLEYLYLRSWMGLCFSQKEQTERKIQFGKVDQCSTSNNVTTAKYTLLNFFPKCLFLQFMRLSNIIFTFNAVLQSIPILSTISPLIAIFPVIFVLSTSMIRQAYEDYVNFTLPRKDTKKMTKSILAKQEY